MVTRGSGVAGGRADRKGGRSSGGWSWAVPGRRWMHNLCGFAHGTAGIGYALAELFGVTGDARFRDAAERAFDHERSWFDSQSGAWQDLRDVARTAGRDAPMPTADWWCNGAAGIALSRRRAAELLGTAAVQRDADIALAACERHASSFSRTPQRISRSVTAPPARATCCCPRARRGRVCTPSSRPGSAPWRRVPPSIGKEELHVRGS